jgi:hypothetical protein
MKNASIITLFLLALLIGSDALGQCTGGTAQAAITPTGVFQTVSSRAGRYKPFNATAGTAYVFT